MKVKEHSVSAKIIRELTEKLRESTQNCHFCARPLVRMSECNVDFRKYDVNFLNTSVENALLVCKECLVDRHKRNYHAYIDARFAELSAHFQNFTALKHASLLERNAAGELASPEPASNVVSEPANSALDRIVSVWDEEDDDAAIYHPEDDD